MHRFRPGLVSQLTKSGYLSQAVSPLPGLCQLAAPTLCAVTAAIPFTLGEARPVTNCISLRSFAAEPCRVEDQQSAAEAVFKVPDNRPPALYQPATFPFFARAYYVGMILYKRSETGNACIYFRVFDSRDDACRQLNQPVTVDKKGTQAWIPHLCWQRDGPHMCRCKHQGQAGGGWHCDSELHFHKKLHFCQLCSRWLMGCSNCTTAR